MIYLFLAEGFEEIEALTPLDMLRRADVSVETVGVGSKTVQGAHGVGVIADRTEDQVDFRAMDGIILPGGMPGTKNLEASPLVQKAIDHCMKNDLLVAAICAAPSILGHKGLLKGKHATCFPGFEQDCAGAVIEQTAVVSHGNIITAKGAGCALAFGKAIVARIKDVAEADDLVLAMQGEL